MSGLYHRSEKGFALVWIMGYMILSGLGNGLSDGAGLARPVTAAVHAALALLLLFWIRRNALCEKYGLRRPALPAKRLLYYLPLVLTASMQLWNGGGPRCGVPETLLFVADMCCVGVLEELLFRGLLFRALEQDGPKTAAVGSALFFGLCHSVNFFNGSGQNALTTAVQIMLAVLTGLVLALLFRRCASLLPGVLFHAAYNALYLFGAEAGAATAPGTRRELVVLLLLLGGYCLYLARPVPGER